MTVMLYVVRHGDSVFNAAGRAEGHYDSGLTSAAIDYTLRTAEVLAQEPQPPTCVYSSDLPRAYYTAALIAERLGLADTACHRSGFLREVNYGDMAGTRFDDFPALYRRDMDALFPNGESRNFMRTRVLYYVEHHLLARPPGSVLLIAHGGSLRALLARYAGADFRDTYDGPLNKDIFRFAIDHGEARRLDRL